MCKYLYNIKSKLKLACFINIFRLYLIILVFPHEIKGPLPIKIIYIIKNVLFYLNE
jgi:hypothetical protein